jgi:hypothetical protein
MVSIPKSLIVLSTGFLERRENHHHESDEHNVSRCTWSRPEIDEEESLDSGFRSDCEACKVYPVSNCMNPCEEDDRPCDEFVERDIFVKVDDTVKMGASEEGD